MSFKKKILVVVLVLLSVPVLLTLVNVVQKMRNTAAAKDKVYFARQATEKTADEKVSQALDVLKQSGVVGPTIGSSKVDACYLSPVSEGFSTRNWTQICYLRYTEGFMTNLSKDEVKQEMKTAGMIKYLDERNAGGCTIFEKDYDNNTREESTVYFMPANPKPDDYDCKVPNPLRGTRDTYITWLNNESVKTYKTFDKNTVDNSQNQVWVTLSEQYYNEDLGCAVKIIDCISPRSKPVHPDI
jgi:hypothetical protein